MSLCAEKCFSLSDALHELKNSSFPQNKRFSFTVSFTLCLQKPLVFSTKTPLIRTTFYCPQKPPFTYKNLSFAQTFLYYHPKQSFSTLRSPFQPPLTYCPQKNSIFTNQKPFFCTNLSLLPSKAILFHPPPPISTPLNLLFAKNAAVLLLFALNPYAVKPERRTDSNHCRRYPAKLQLFAKPVT